MIELHDAEGPQSCWSHTLVVLSERQYYQGPAPYLVTPGLFERTGPGVLTSALRTELKAFFMISICL